MDLKLDATGDIAVENNTFVLIDGVDAIAQDITIRLRFFLGEWFLDTRLGIPYFEKLLGEKLNISTAKSIFRKAILSTPGVLNVGNFETSFDGHTRQLRIAFNAESTEGPLVYDKDLVI